MLIVGVPGFMVIVVTVSGDRVVVGAASCVVVVSVVYHNLVGALVNFEGLSVTSVVFVCHNNLCVGLRYKD